MLRHTLRRGALAATTVIALTAGGGLIPPAGTAAAAEPVPQAQETVVPAAPGQSLLPASLYLNGQSRDLRADAIGAGGVFHTQSGHEGVLWTRFSDGRSTPVPLPAETGTTVVGTGTDSLALLRSGEVEWRAADGTSRKIALPEGWRANSVFGSTVYAWRSVAQSDGTRKTEHRLFSLRTDGTTHEVPITGPDEDTPLGMVSGGDESDVVVTTRTSDGKRRFGFAPVDTGRVGTLTPEVPGAYARVKVSPEYLAVYSTDATNETVLVTSRTDPSAPFTAIDLDNYDADGTYDRKFAIVGDWLVYRAPWKGLKAVPIAGGPAVTLLPQAYDTPSAGPDGTAAVIGGSDSVDWALRRITADSSGKPVVTVAKRLPKPAVVAGIALAQGKLSVVDDSAGTMYEWGRDVSTSGPPAHGARTRLTGVPLPRCTANDVQCAEYRALGDGRFVRRVETSDTSWRYYVNGPGDDDREDVYLPAGARIDDVSADYLVDTAPGAAGKQTVRRIDTDEVLEERAPVAAALWGTRLWSAGTEKGVVTAKDLDARKVVESVNTGAPCVPSELQAAGRWLYWSCGADGPAGVYDRTAKSSRSVPPGEALLGDGYVVTHDKTAGTLVLTGAAADAPASRIVGTMPDTGVSQRHVRWTVDTFGGHLAYVDAEEQVHVVATGIAAQALTVLKGWSSSAAVDAQRGNYFLTRQYSKPVASWTLTARHSGSAGNVVELASGTDVRRELEISWSGRDKAGTLLPNGTYTWTLTAAPADGVGPAVQEMGTVILINGASLASSRFSPVTGTTEQPARILDTRSGVGVRQGRVGPGGSVTLQVTGRGQVPTTGVTAVALNVTAVNPSASTYVTVHPYGTARPNASNLNVPAGRIVAGMVVVPVRDGRITLDNHAGGVDLLADVTGYYTTGPGVLFEPLRPARIVDSRTGLGIAKRRLEEGVIGWSPVLGRGGVPKTNVSAVVLQLTATNVTKSTFVSAYGTAYAPAYVHSHVQVAAGQTASNLVVVPVGDDSLAFLNRSGATDVIADVVGYYRYDDLGSLFQPLAPSRSLDTRTGTGAPQAKVGPGRTVTLTVAGRNGVPATGATAVVMNVTATNATSGTYVTVHPYGTSRPGTSNLNVPAGRTVSNVVVVPVKDGRVTLYNHAGSVDLIADVQGFYAP